MQTRVGSASLKENSALLVPETLRLHSKNESEELPSGGQLVRIDMGTIAPHATFYLKPQFNDKDWVSVAAAVRPTDEPKKANMEWFALPSSCLVHVELPRVLAAAAVSHGHGSPSDVTPCGAHGKASSPSPLPPSPLAKTPYHDECVIHVPFLWTKRATKAGDQDLRVYVPRTIARVPAPAVIKTSDLLKSEAKKPAEGEGAEKRQRLG